MERREAQVSGTLDRLALLRERISPPDSPQRVGVSSEPQWRVPGLPQVARRYLDRMSAAYARARRPLSLATTLVLWGTAVVVLGALAVSLGPRLIGYSSIVIQGGSMATSLPAGSIAVTEQVPAEAISVGDVILYHPPATSPDHASVMHRVVSVREEDGQVLFRTKGDANSTPDPWEFGLEGNGARLVYAVPYVGYLVAYVRTPVGWVLVFMLPAACLGFTTLRRIWAGRPPAR
jgi:signal peptidase